MGNGRDQCTVLDTVACAHDQGLPDLLHHSEIEEPDLTASGRHSLPRPEVRRVLLQRGRSGNHPMARNQKEWPAGGTLP